MYVFWKSLRKLCVSYAIQDCISTSQKFVFLYIFYIFNNYQQIYESIKEIWILSIFFHSSLFSKLLFYIINCYSHIFHDSFTDPCTIPMTKKSSLLNKSLERICEQNPPCCLNCNLFLFLLLINPTFWPFICPSLGCLPCTEEGHIILILFRCYKFHIRPIHFLSRALLLVYSFRISFCW